MPKAGPSPEGGTLNLVDYVIDRCRKDPDTGCIVWAAAVNNSGRPVFRLACCGTRDPRRVLWEAAGLPFIESHVFIEPKCIDGKRCINPDHQRRMTRRQAGKRPGVKSSGPRHSAAVARGARKRPTSILTMEIARQMRARYHEIGNAAQVAREFGVAHAHTHKVVRNQMWREPTPWGI